MFFVSVASKELRLHVSALESTHTGIPLSVDSKGVARGNFRHILAGLVEGLHTFTKDIYTTIGRRIQGRFAARLPQTIPQRMDKLRSFPTGSEPSVAPLRMTDGWGLR